MNSTQVQYCRVFTYTEAGEAFSLEIGCMKFPEQSETATCTMEINVLLASAPNTSSDLSPFRSSSENCINIDVPSPVL